MTTVGLKLAAGGVVLAAVTAYMAYLGASSSWQYYVTVDECSADAASLIGRRLRVSGRVAADSLHIQPDRKRARFELCGESGRIQAVCPAPLPDNLAEDMEVVVEGRLTSKTQLDGERVLTRCASKYEAQQ